MGRKYVACSATLWVALVVTLALMPMRVVSEATSTGALKDMEVAISITPDVPRVGDYVAVSVRLFNNGSQAITFNYSFYIEDYLLETGKGLSWQQLDHINPLIIYGWTFDRPGVYQVRVIITEVNGTGELQAWNNVTVAPNSSYFSWSSGSLKSLKPLIQLVPCKSGIGFFVYGSLINTGESDLVVNYTWFGGFGNPLGNGSDFVVPSAPNNRVFLNHTYWAADPTGNGMYPLGINITDVNGTGRLVQYQVITVNEFFGNGTGPLCGVVCVQPEAREGELVAARFLMSNVGNSTLHSVRYSIYAGLGRYLAGGNLGDLMPGRLCQSIPDGIVELQAYWTPTTAGTYRFGINVSDENGTCSVSAYIDITVHEGSPAVRITITPEEYEYFLEKDRPLLSCLTVSYKGPGEGRYFIDCLYVPNAFRIAISLNQTTMMPSFYLAENLSETRMLTFIPAIDAAGGPYDITIAVRDEASQVIVAATVIHVTIYVPPLVADLSVDTADIDLSPMNATEGTPCILLVKVRNSGDGRGTGLLNVSDLNGTIITLQEIGMDPYSTFDLFFNWSPTAGNHTVRVSIETLSGGNRIPENDNASLTFQIQPTVAPPPVIPRLSLMLEANNVSLAPGETILVNLSFECYEAWVFMIKVQAVWSGDFPIVTQILNPPSQLGPGDRWASQLRITAPAKTEGASRTGTIEVSVEGTDVSRESTFIAVRIIEGRATKTETASPAIGAIAVVSIVIVAAAIIGGTEVGFVAFLSLFLPLYVKIRKDEVLDQFTRGKIQGYITAYPGEHYNSIKTQLGLNNGVLAYHLRVLEREGYVTSLRDGVYKRFYPKETPLPRKRGQFSAIQDMIIENIREEPGITQDGLARKMKVSNQVVHYHIRTLMAAGAVRVEKVGKETHCYIGESENSGSYAGLSF